ncbi:MAG: TspO/MBR family protein [Oricola sp.]
MQISPETPTPRNWLTLVLFVFFVLGGGTLIGISFQPGDWYAGLQKPPFNPPNWIFAPVWSLLYIFIAIAGWRTWSRRPASLAMQVWFVQLAFNFMWTSVFFGMQLPGLAFLVIAIILGLIIVFIRLTWKQDRASAVFFLPYGAWTAFAAVLNLAIWWLN